MSIFFFLNIFWFEVRLTARYASAPPSVRPNLTYLIRSYVLTQGLTWAQELGIKKISSSFIRILVNGSLRVGGRSWLVLDSGFDYFRFYLYFYPRLSSNVLPFWIRIQVSPLHLDGRVKEKNFKASVQMPVPVGKRSRPVKICQCTCVDRGIPGLNAVQFGVATQSCLKLRKRTW